MATLSDLYKVASMSDAEIVARGYAVMYSPDGSRYLCRREYNPFSKSVRWVPAVLTQGNNKRP